MKEIIKWLKEIEHLAGEMYQQAAVIYASDDNLREFLEDNAEDEAWHYHVMGSAESFLESEPDFSPAITVDEKTNEKIIGQITAITDGLAQNTISRDELITRIVGLELSEWNYLFIYAVNFLKDKSSEFKYPVARIQAHINDIEYFLETVEKRPDALKKLKELPAIWVENILIVDDDEMIGDLMKALLNPSGNIDIAVNGEEALKLMETKYYKLIVSDIDMPIMDGITLYNEAVDKYPDLNHRFLFMTGYLSPERQAFFDQKQLKYMAKPMDINVLREEAAKILSSK